ncbi:MAG: hypothetical protein ACTS27_11920 [Phycisphaerales bacterium]
MNSGIDWNNQIVGALLALIAALIVTLLTRRTPKLKTYYSISRHFAPWPAIKSLVQSKGVLAEMIAAIGEVESQPATLDAKLKSELKIAQEKLGGRSLEVLANANCCLHLTIENRGRAVASNLKIKLPSLEQAILVQDGKRTDYHDAVSSVEVLAIQPRARASIFGWSNLKPDGLAREVKLHGSIHHDAGSMRFGMQETVYRVHTRWSRLFSALYSACAFSGMWLWFVLIWTFGQRVWQQIFHAVE